MTLIGNFFYLKPSDKIYVIKTFFYSYYIRLIIWGLPFSRVKKIADEMGKKKVIKPQINIEKILWAINVTDPFVVKSTCLTKAITAQMLLSKHNYASKLRIGVIKDEKFEAHAWLEVDGHVVVGNLEKEFVSLVDM